MIHQDGALWSFSAQEQFGFEYDGGIRLLHWTADEKFLYFSLKRYAGDGPNPVDYNAEVLFRMDLSNGKVSIILGNPATAKIDNPYNLYVVSISPTSRYLVYSIDGPSLPQLHFIDLRSGDEKVIDIDPQYESIGDFSWSDVGRQFVYKLYVPPSQKDNYCSYTYSIRLLNLEDFSSTTFVKNERVDLCESDLPEFNVVKISVSDVVLKQHENIWVYHIESQRLELQGTLTPLP